ncbi:MAG: hypothetical protein R3C59_26755 [Planctomycetaceae bacterium]
MSRRRTGQAIVGALVALLLVATLFISPGFRHAHKHGDADHSHASTSGSEHHGSHGHSHGDHSHSHGDHSHDHGHSHGDHSHGHDHRHETDDASTNSDFGELSESHSHIHISFLWFELTLPDWFGDDVAVSVASDADGVSGERRNSVNGDVVSISSPFTFAQLVQVLVLSVGPVPERTRLPVPLGRIRLLSTIAALHQRVPDDVPVPPPELS